MFSTFFTCPEYTLFTPLHSLDCLFRFSEPLGHLDHFLLVLETDLKYYLDSRLA
jgi:hypothetical protein